LTAATLHGDCVNKPAVICDDDALLVVAETTATVESAAFLRGTGNLALASGCLGAPPPPPLASPLDNLATDGTVLAAAAFLRGAAAAFLPRPTYKTTHTHTSV